MKIKINDKVLCFPPYISTSWEHVKALQVENDPSASAEVLVVILDDGTRIKIPHLDQKIVAAIFSAHLKFIEQQTFDKPEQRLPGNVAAETAAFPIRLGIGALDNLGSALQHNPAQADMPDLPSEIVQKISSIAKVIGPEEAMSIPQAHEGCNCLHCQIARAIQACFETQTEAEEEIVTDEDLRFRLWDITQNGEKLYTVTNPLDSQEQYNVYLGEPIGCTCGHRNCEHLRAVLNT